MSVSVSLQGAIYVRLRDDPAVSALVQGRVYDGVPADAAFPYISFGASDYVPDDADCIDGREETIQIDCWSSDQGRKWPCKELVDTVKKALHDAELKLNDGALVVMSVTLTRVLSDPDGITAHGVVHVTAIIEE